MKFVSQLLLDLQRHYNYKFSQEYIKANHHFATMWFQKVYYSELQHNQVLINLCNSLVFFFPRPLFSSSDEHHDSNRGFFGTLFHRQRPYIGPSGQLFLLWLLKTHQCYTYCDYRYQRPVFYSNVNKCKSHDYAGGHLPVKIFLSINLDVAEDYKRLACNFSSSSHMIFPISSSLPQKSERKELKP